MERRRSHEVPLAALLLASLLSGCGMISAGLIGFANTHATLQRAGLEPDDVAAVPLREPVRLRLRDGTMRSGVYDGLVLMDAPRYDSLSAGRLPSVLPALGETVHLRLRYGQEATGRFAGVDPQVVLLDEAGTVRARDLRLIESFEREEAPRVSGDSLRALALGPTWIPRSEVLLQSGAGRGWRDDRVRVPLEDVVGIDVVQRPRIAESMMVGGVLADLGWAVILHGIFSGFGEALR